MNYERKTTDEQRLDVKLSRNHGRMASNAHAVVLDLYAAEAALAEAQRERDALKAQLDSATSMIDTYNRTFGAIEALVHDQPGESIIEKTKALRDERAAARREAIEECAARMCPLCAAKCGEVAWLNSTIEWCHLTPNGARSCDAAPLRPMLAPANNGDQQ